MFKYWIRKNIIFNLMTFFSFIIFCFFMSHIFFGNRSVWKIFELNHQIKDDLKITSRMIEMPEDPEIKNIILKLLFKKYFSKIIQLNN